MNCVMSKPPAFITAPAMPVPQMLSIGLLALCMAFQQFEFRHSQSGTGAYEATDEVEHEILLRGRPARHNEFFPLASRDKHFVEAQLNLGKDRF